MLCSRGMATITAQQLLDQCEAAILAILSGAQSATVGQRSYTRANLGELRSLRRELRGETLNDRAIANGQARYTARTYAKNGGRG